MGKYIASFFLFYDLINQVTTSISYHNHTFVKKKLKQNMMVELAPLGLVGQKKTKQKNQSTYPATYDIHSIVPPYL